MGDSVKAASTTPSSSRARLAQARLRKLKAQRQLRHIDGENQYFPKRRKYKILKTKRRYGQKC
ncbi:hypothetical protein DPMN_052697 [Dreissena polymorpha]|uniref:Uncharacterized protein n=1 Tax=Dreissena polymorpha TaxID=45954 RepID=A0A9D4CKW5_DREPO|nr:hypothetical protein DPMN_052697 [Dreissena polymorpha]